MSEPLTQPPSDSKCEQPNRRPQPPQLVGKGFQPGNNACPRGRETITDYVRAEALDLVANFETRHNRPPTRSERSDIEIAAHFRVQAMRDRLPMVDRNKAARTAALYLRKLSLDRPAPSPLNGSNGGGLMRRYKIAP